MATISFAPKNASLKTSPIIAFLTDGRDYKVKLYPGISIPTKYWSKRNRCVTSGYPQAVSVNSYLEEYKADLFDVYLKAKTKGLVRKVQLQKGFEFHPKAAYYKSEIEKLRFSRSGFEVEIMTFWQLWKAFLKAQKSTFKAHSIKKYESLAVHLEEFEKEFGKLDVDALSDVDLEDFQVFCYNRRGLNTQTTSKYIGFFKAFLNWCVRRKHTSNTDFRNFRSIRQPDSLKVIVSTSELLTIAELDLVRTPHLHNVRQLFILSCETGLRYSDYSKVNKQHLKKDNDGTYLLKIRLQKSDNDVEIPLTPMAHSIVQQLIKGDIHPITNQKMNEYVKTVAERAGLDEPFETFRYVGRNKVSSIKPKYDLITTHTGRRTYATNLLNQGVPAEVVMQFTGHKDYKSFEKYVNIPKGAQKEMIKKAQRKALMSVSA